MPDGEILARLELDPETGMREVLAQHGPALLGRLRTHAHRGRYGDLNVEDVFQEALLRLIEPENRAALQSAGGEILPWLSRWGYWRLDDAARRSGLPVADPPQPEAGEETMSAAVQVLRSVIHLLSPRDRLVLRLRYEESRSNAGLAVALGMSEGAAKKAAHDARERLRLLMTEAGFDPDERG